MVRNSSLRLRLSTLALAGLAAGLVPGAAQAGSMDKDGCHGKSSCKGMKADSAKVVASKADTSSCSGNGKCGGVAAPAKDTILAARKTALLAAKTEKDFQAACKSAGKEAAKASCAGKNSCAGVYFNGGKAVEVSCKGKASCHGLSCAI